MDTKALEGRTIVITGASSGFGKGAAIAFAKARANIVIAARREEALQAVVRECEQVGPGAIAVVTDVSEQADMEALARTALERYGRIDTWVNNAGVGVLGRVEEVPLADHVQVIKTNLIGVLYGTYLALRQFRKQGRGTLINVASELGRGTAPYYGSYSAAKHGVVALSSAVRQELMADEIRDIHVCTVMPAAMDTPFFDHAGNYTGHEVQPIPPLYDPQKVVDAIVELAIEPEDEVVVGAMGKWRTEMGEMMPRLTEHLTAKMSYKLQMEESPPAAATAGSVHSPQKEGTAVSAGRRNR